MTRQAGDFKNVSDVREVFDGWISAVQARNLKGVIDRHSHDVLMFDVAGRPQSWGIDSYRSTLGPFFRWLGDRGVFEHSELSITAGDDVAFSHCMIRCEGAEGHGSYVPVRLTTCYRKIDGRWTIVHEHHSVVYQPG